MIQVLLQGGSSSPAARDAASSAPTCGAGTEYGTPGRYPSFSQDTATTAPGSSTPTSSTLEPQFVVHFGWLSKRGRAVKSWKRRFFQIRGTQLAYFNVQLDADGSPIISTAETPVPSPSLLASASLPSASHWGWLAPSWHRNRSGSNSASLLRARAGADSGIARESSSTSVASLPGSGSGSGSSSSSSNLLVQPLASPPPSPAAHAVRRGVHHHAVWGTAPLGVLELAGGCRIEAAPKPDKPFRFYVHAPQRSLCLQAESLADMNTWIRVLKIIAAAP
ncbi:MAG: hypothetical protein EOO65_04770 [Methanosarcinales archaeon]|nr:MAG: hypothetical protein EOO65_04770 [Methanosarcinales archaeon]